MGYITFEHVCKYYQTGDTVVKALDDEVLLRGAGHVHERAGPHGMGSLIVVALGDDGAGEHIPDSDKKRTDSVCERMAD